MTAQDIVDRGVVVAGALLGVDLRSHVARPVPAPDTGAPFAVEEITDAETGEIAYVVTDGAHRTEAPTRADADALLAALAERGLPVSR